MPVLAVALLFFLSGVSALIYQVVWLRLLALVFGVTVHAASTVLGCFMAGLALGSVFAGRLADRVERPLLWFGAAEILIAGTALASPFVLDALAAVYVPLGADVPAGVRPLVRGLCSAVVLLPPTCLMGATLPLVLRSALVEDERIGSRVSLLYGINTAGAIAGVVLAGYWLIGALGVTATVRVAAGLNLLVGVSALGLAVWLPPGRRTVAAAREGQAAGSAPPVAVGAVMPLAFAVSGMTSLALEVIWFRVLVLYFPATTYAFTAMLAAVLSGIAVGSLMIAPVLRRAAPTAAWFGVLQAAVGTASVVGYLLLASNYRADWALDGLVAGAAVAVVPAAVLMGAAFPLGIRVSTPTAGRAGTIVGRLYGANLLGAIAGSVVGGFLLLPRFGSASSLTIAAALNVVAGVLLAMAGPRRTWRTAAVAAALVVAFVAAASDLPDPVVTGMAKRYPHAGHVFFRDEGVQTTVSVHVREIGGRQLYLDGLHQASDGEDVVRLHRQIGHLPVLLHPAPKRALVIGLGGGATAGAVSVHPGLRVSVVELAPGVVDAARWFSHINEDVLDRPNVRLRVDDARNYLLLGQHRYDVITADIIQPTHAGAGLLYSREYFELARRALADDGVMVQWIGSRPDSHYRLIARTFQSVFPEATAWAGGELLVGSVRPLAIDEAALTRRLAAMRSLPSLEAAGFGDAASVLNHFTAGPAALRRFLGEGPILTDDRPLLEYFLSLPRAEPTIDLKGLR